MQNNPRYLVTPLYTEEGQVASHYMDAEFASFCMTWDQALADPHFARIIEKDLEAETVADKPLDYLADYAANERIRVRFLAWLGFIDLSLDPWTTGGAIHFRPHWARTLMLALTMADAAGLSDADLDAVAAAAVFHDSRRKNPYLDTGHGDRAAYYYAEYCAHLMQKQPVTAGQNAVAAVAGEEDAAPAPLLRFDPRTYLAVQWHDRDDADGLRVIALAEERDELPTSSPSRERRPRLHRTSEAFQGMEHAQVLLPRGLAAALPSGAEAAPVLLYKLFKDADALDRIRLGKDGLDPRYLRLPYAHEALPLAHELFNACSRM